VYEREYFGGTSLMSLNPARTEGSSTGASQPSLSYNGVVLAMATVVQTGIPGNDHAQILVADRSSHTLSIASANAAGTDVGDGDSASPSLSALGDVVAYASSAGNLTTEHLGPGIYVTAIRTHSTTLASPSVTTGRNAAGSFAEPALSSSGTTVAFSSDSHDLIRNSPVTNNESQIYVRDLRRSVTTLASIPSIAVEGADSDASGASLTANGDVVAFTSTATNLVPGTAPREQVYLRNRQQVPGVERVGGADRFVVSASVSATTFGTGVPAVIIASGATFPDALSGSAAAGALHAPVLLVTKDGVPATVSAELTRLRPQKIILLGGTDTIGTAVEHDLAAFAPAVSRIGGQDRFAVSAAVSAAAFGLSGAPTPVAYVASGAVFPDALSGSAAAGYSGAPVLLVRQDAVPAPVSAELARLRPGRIVVLGGTNSVDDPTAAALAAIAPTTRIAGADRFEVSAGTSAASFSPGTRTAYVASGAVFPDALSGSAAAIRRSGPVLLVTGTAIPDPVKAELLRLKPTRIIILGGPATVSDAVQTELASYAVAPG
jgi:putative cell wall-binding protein